MEVITRIAQLNRKSRGHVEHVSLFTLNKPEVRQLTHDNDRRWDEGSNEKTEDENSDNDAKALDQVHVCYFDGFCWPYAKNHGNSERKEHGEYGFLDGCRARPCQA